MAPGGALQPLGWNSCGDVKTAPCGAVRAETLVVVTDSDQLRRWSGEKPPRSHGEGLGLAGGIFLTGGVRGCLGRCGAETAGAVSALAMWACPLVAGVRALDRLCQGRSAVDLRLGRLLNPLAENIS